MHATTDLLITIAQIIILLLTCIVVGYGILVRNQARAALEANKKLLAGHFKPVKIGHPDDMLSFQDDTRRTNVIPFPDPWPGVSADDFRHEAGEVIAGEILQHWRDEREREQRTKTSDGELPHRSIDNPYRLR